MKIQTKILSKIHLAFFVSGERQSGISQPTAADCWIKIHSAEVEENKTENHFVVVICLWILCMCVMCARFMFVCIVCILFTVWILRSIQLPVCRCPLQFSTFSADALWPCVSSMPDKHWRVAQSARTNTSTPKIITENQTYEGTQNEIAARNWRLYSLNHLLVKLYAVGLSVACRPSLIRVSMSNFPVMQCCARWLEVCWGGSDGSACKLAFQISGCWERKSRRRTANKKWANA